MQCRKTRNSTGNESYHPFGGLTQRDSTQAHSHIECGRVHKLFSKTHGLTSNLKGALAAKGKEVELKKYLTENMNDYIDSQDLPD